jgi:hypothetical protein
MWQELTHFDDQEFIGEATRTSLGYLMLALAPRVKEVLAKLKLS